ncbi:electron transport complex subunit RsxB [Candidatus Venteria ishoeyi]|uniref:electron transport complex subunit RsxB n=1 Tax=Candidatus Venteria ishoeyi TaxID=1899563 RepID=UPI0025A680AE|nr:electron transport complex subunit RsxB [Candidatus Venteria ishoeyi]MDM8545618.1 electron transport complex subunit RsxB [Candidatus Venteria ishoeyi]
MFVALMVAGGLALSFGLILGYASVRFRVEGNPVVDQLDELLPQTQCGKCTYPGCRPYAEAIVNEDAPINLCSPGGESTMLNIAQLLDREPLPMDEVVQEEKHRLAVINEDLCIGCTLCIQACPVDAILGASKLMHTVIAQECTGCELCLPPCPVDCIDMVEVPMTPSSWSWPSPEQSPNLINGTSVEESTTS